MHLLTFLFTLSLVCATINATNIKCSRYKINNGRVRMKTNQKFVRFLCNKGYMLIGTKYSGCANGYFDTYPPICVNNKPNCKKINVLNNGLIIPEANNVVVHFFCKPEFKLIGSNVTICDGNNWIFQLPYCTPMASPEQETNCDFEREDLCGWSHDLNHDFDWKWTNLQTPTPETGPRFDHTKGEQKNGHYMYVESTSRLPNDSSRLISPIFAKMPQICVRFYYHMYGRDMGTLNVYVKQESEDFQKLRPLFSVDGNQGDFWNLGLISLENGTAGPFQVIFEGIRGKSYFSDIAIDDVSINGEPCPEEQTTETLYDSTDQTSEMPFFDSCLNRCGENDTNFENLTSCSCDENCFELNLCCADFIQQCLLGFLGTSIDYEDVVETSTLGVSESSDTTSEVILKTTDLMNPTIPTTSATPTTSKTSTKLTEITSTKMYTKPKIIIPKKIRTTTTSTTTTSTTSSTTTTTTTAATTLPSTTTIFQVDPTLSSPKIKIETDFLVTTLQPNVQYLQQNTKNHETKSYLFVYLGVVGSVVLVAVFIVLTIVVVKRNNLNCKKFTGSRNNDSMSDVRFLASDEVLDFTWKGAESL